jgi:hypothetical protein
MAQDHWTINMITFRRKVNSGNFESFDVEAMISVAGDTTDAEAQAAADRLQAFVDHVCNTRMDTLRRPGAHGGKDAPEFPEL